MPSSTAAYTNISCYKFTPLADLKPLRARLLESCRTWGLKGTILLSAEGINLFVAGLHADIDRLVALLRALPGLSDLTPKVSLSDEQPFNRMLVRIKKEIIAFGVEGIDPARRTSPKLSAQTLKQWLDEGRPITLYDTRNDYEVKLGTFSGALPAGIQHFRDFPRAVRQLPETLKNTPIVMFCTGGIRCEKAGPFMESEGFREVYQLDGGILKYFEEVGGAHYTGECFVFDQRVGVDPALRESNSTQCYACQTPLTEEEQHHPHYQPPHACPYCYQTSEAKQAAILRQRHEAIRRVTTPLPGSVPAANRRPLIPAAEHEGMPLHGFLATLFPQIPAATWVERCAAGQMRDAADQPLTLDAPVHAGQRITHVRWAHTEPPVNADIRILYEDEAIAVIDKPAPLPMHPSGRFERNTLQHILEQVYPQHCPRPAHRLDADTTGIVLCARSRAWAGKLQPQFSRGEIEKSYLARVHGRPSSPVFRCEAPVSALPDAKGLRQIDEAQGQAACTEFRLLAYRAEDDTSLVEARPISGRTNQIRIHLWTLGHPIVGDPTYLRGGQLDEVHTLAVEAPPLCLHAHRITFTHPKTKVRTTFTSPAPAGLIGDAVID